MALRLILQVIGHPCCISVYGECRITTKEFCDFVNGYFHEEASLCSQVYTIHSLAIRIQFARLTHTHTNALYLLSHFRLAGVMLERYMRNVSIYIARHTRSILSFIYVAVSARGSHTFSNHNCLSAHFHGRFGTSTWTNTNGRTLYWKWRRWQFDQLYIFAVQTRGNDYAFYAILARNSHPEKMHIFRLQFYCNF